MLRPARAPCGAVLRAIMTECAEKVSLLRSHAWPAAAVVENMSNLWFTSKMEQASPVASTIREPQLAHVFYDGMRAASPSSLTSVNLFSLHVPAPIRDVAGQVEIGNVTISVFGEIAASFIALVRAIQVEDLDGAGSVAIRDVAMHLDGNCSAETVYFEAVTCGGFVTSIRDNVEIANVVAVAAQGLDASTTVTATGIDFSKAVEKTGAVGIRDCTLRVSRCVSSTSSVAVYGVWLEGLLEQISSAFSVSNFTLEVTHGLAASADARVSAFYFAGDVMNLGALSLCNSTIRLGNVTADEGKITIVGAYFGASLWNDAGGSLALSGIVVSVEQLASKMALSCAALHVVSSVDECSAIRLERISLRIDGAAQSSASTVEVYGARFDSAVSHISGTFLVSNVDIAASSELQAAAGVTVAGVSLSGTLLAVGSVEVRNSAVRVGACRASSGTVKYFGIFLNSVINVSSSVSVANFELAAGELNSAATSVTAKAVVVNDVMSLVTSLRVQRVRLEVGNVASASTLTLSVLSFEPSASASRGSFSLSAVDLALVASGALTSSQADVSATALDLEYGQSCIDSAQIQSIDVRILLSVSARTRLEIFGVYVAPKIANASSSPVAVSNVAVVVGALSTLGQVLIAAVRFLGTISNVSSIRLQGVTLATVGSVNSSTSNVQIFCVHAMEKITQVLSSVEVADVSFVASGKISAGGLIEVRAIYFYEEVSTVASMRIWNASCSVTALTAVNSIRLFVFYCYSRLGNVSAAVSISSCSLRATDALSCSAGHMASSIAFFMEPLANVGSFSCSNASWSVETVTAGGQLSLAALYFYEALANVSHSFVAENLCMVASGPIAGSTFADVRVFLVREFVSDVKSLEFKNISLSVRSVSSDTRYAKVCGVFLKGLLGARMSFSASKIIVATSGNVSAPSRVDVSLVHVVSLAPKLDGEFELSDGALGLSGAISASTGAANLFGLLMGGFESSSTTATASLTLRRVSVRCAASVAASSLAAAVAALGCGSGAAPMYTVRGALEVDSCSLQVTNLTAGSPQPAVVGGNVSIVDAEAVFVTETKIRDSDLSFAFPESAASQQNAPSPARFSFLLLRPECTAARLQLQPPASSSGSPLAVALSGNRMLATASGTSSASALPCDAESCAMLALGRGSGVAFGASANFSLEGNTLSNLNGSAVVWSADFFTDHKQRAGANFSLSFDANDLKHGAIATRVSASAFDASSLVADADFAQSAWSFGCNTWPPREPRAFIALAAATANVTLRTHHCTPTASRSQTKTRSVEVTPPPTLTPQATNTSEGTSSHTITRTATDSQRATQSTRAQSQTATHYDQPEPEIAGALSEAVLAASAASANALAAAASIGGASTAAMTANRLLVVAPLIGCTTQNEKGEKWLDAELAFPTTLFPPSVGVGSGSGRYARAALVSNLVLVVVLVLAAACFALTRLRKKFTKLGPLLVMKVATFAVAQCVSALGEASGMLLLGVSFADTIFALAVALVLLACAAAAAFHIHLAIKKPPHSESSSARKRPLLCFVEGEMRPMKDEKGAEVADFSASGMECLNGRFGRFFCVGDFFWTNPTFSGVWPLVKKLHGTNVRALLADNNSNGARRISSSMAQSASVLRGKLRGVLGPYTFVVMALLTLLCSAASGIAKAAPRAQCRTMLAVIAACNSLVFAFDLLVDPMIVPFLAKTDLVVDGVAALVSIIVASSLRSPEEAAGREHLVAFVSVVAVVIVLAGSSLCVLSIALTRVWVVKSKVEMFPKKKQSGASNLRDQFAQALLSSVAVERQSGNRFRSRDDEEMREASAMLAPNNSASPVAAAAAASAAPKPRAASSPRRNADPSAIAPKFADLLLESEKPRESTTAQDIVKIFRKKKRQMRKTEESPPATEKELEEKVSKNSHR